MTMREVDDRTLGVRGTDTAGRGVLVVGAGPVGLVAAIDLARRGVDVRVVDAAAGPAAGSRGKGLQPRSIEVLDDLGVAGRIVAAGRSRLPIRKYRGRTVIGDSDVNPGSRGTHRFHSLSPYTAHPPVARGRSAS